MMIDEVTQYAQDVVDGKYTVCEANYLACKRHLDDLEKSKLAPYRYYFNVEESQMIIEFGETLRLAEQGGIEVKLFPFQKFICGSLMGWRVKEDNSWRYRLSNVSFARQNGKSFLNGLIMTYGSNFTDSLEGQFYIVANTRAQGKICFKEIVKFIESDKELQELYKVREYKSEIDCHLTKAEIKVLTREEAKKDGNRPTIATVDEYHQAPKSDLFDCLKNGQGALSSSIISIISTAGSNLSYPYYKWYIHSKKILSGEIIDDRTFVFICELDKGDSWEDKSNYIKANPLYDEKKIDLLYDEFLRQREFGNKELVDLATKRFNIWVADESENYLTSDIVEKMKTNKTIADFRGRECVIGLDMSSLSDLTSTTFLFKDFLPKNIENYFIKSHSFLPRVAYNRFKKKDKNWIEYVNEGSLTVTDAVGGEALDYKTVITYIKNIIDTYELKPIIVCYDSNNIGGILQDIDETLKIDGMPIRQSMINLTEPTVMFKVLAKNGQVKFEASKLYEFCLNNAVTVQEYGENKCCKIDKKQKDRKIDAIDATIDAMKYALTMKKPKKRADYSAIYNMINNS